MSNLRTGRMLTLYLFWNILGSVCLGFSMLVLVSSSVYVSAVLGDFAEGHKVWDELVNEFIPFYGFILLVVSGSVLVLVGRRVITRKVMGYLQVAGVLAISFIPTLWHYLVD